MITYRFLRGKTELGGPLSYDIRMDLTPPLGVVYFYSWTRHKVEVYKYPISTGL